MQLDCFRILNRQSNFYILVNKQSNYLLNVSFEFCYYLVSSRAETGAEELATVYWSNSFTFIFLI